MRWLVGFVLAIIVCMSQVKAYSDQNLICNQKGGQYKAYYRCPDKYDAIVTGEGSFVCDGACYLRGNRADLDRAIMTLLRNRFGQNVKISPDELNALRETALSSGSAKKTFDGQAFEIRLK